MEPAPDRLVALPTFLTTQVATTAHRLVGEAFAACGARGYHFRILAALDEAGPLSQAELGRRVSVDRSDVVAAVRELEAAGHISRAPDPADRRRNVITITAAGRRQLARLDAELAAAQDAFLEPLSDRDRATYRRLLLRLYRHHRQG